jgi:hypothetical protein
VSHHNLGLAAQGTIDEAFLETIDERREEDDDPHPDPDTGEDQPSLQAALPQVPKGDE